MESFDEKINVLNEMLEKAALDSIFPGCNYVLVCQDKSDETYKTAFGSIGNKALYPEVEKNDLDTLYDMASCSKVISTTTCIIKLMEQGKLRLFDQVSKYLPDFKYDNILIWDLITHTSGLPAGISGVTKIKNREEALEKIYALEPSYEKNSKIVYSDIGFILLGFIIEKISGKSLDVFAKENVFDPLEMFSTGYNPLNKDPNNLKKCAPTEERNDDIVRGMVRGHVHDELSYILGGVAGHAGLFSCVKDIEHFIKMILNDGVYNGKRFLSKASIDLLFTPQVSEPKGVSLTLNTRGIGWIIQGDYCSAGDLASKETILHTGFTGTNVFVDRINKVGFSLLSNRVHPTRKNVLLIPYRGMLGNFIIANFGNRK